GGKRLAAKPLSPRGRGVGVRGMVCLAGRNAIYSSPAKGCGGRCVCVRAQWNPFATHSPSSRPLSPCGGGERAKSWSISGAAVRQEGERPELTGRMALCSREASDEASHRLLDVRVRPGCPDGVGKGRRKGRFGKRATV